MDAFKDFLSSCTNNESGLGFVTTIENPGEVVEIVSSYALSETGGLTKVHFNCRACFSIFLCSLR